MKKIRLLIMLFCISSPFISFSQEIDTKKVRQRVKGVKDIIKEYSVVKNDKKIKHGPYKELYKKEIVVNGSYNNGKKDGFWVYRSPDDSYVQKGSFKNGNKVGNWEGTLNNKQVYTYFYTEDSKLDSLKKYNLEGELVASFGYNPSQDKGEGFVKYNTDFVLKYTTYSHTQDYHGVVEVLYPNGNTYQEKKYYKGKLVWASDVYKDNGEVHRKVNFKNGNGSIVKYFPEELTKGVFIASTKTKYKDSIPNGIKSFLDKEGKIIASGLQYKGDRIGVWKIWSPKKKSYINKEFKEVNLLSSEKEEGIWSNSNYFSIYNYNNVVPCVLMQNTRKKSNYNHKQALSKAINNYVLKNIDISPLVKKAPGGLYKTFIQFKIDALGEVTDIELSNKNKLIGAYVEDVLEEFPRMIPLYSNGSFQRVIYNLPIRLGVKK